MPLPRPEADNLSGAECQVADPVLQVRGEGWGTGTLGCVLAVTPLSPAPTCALDLPLRFLHLSSGPVCLA